MKLSVWRWSHKCLAVASLLFILSASITGIILCFDPLSHNNTKAADSNLPLHVVIEKIKENHTEVLKIQQNNYGEWIADVIHDDGKSETILFQPSTGKKIGLPKEQSAFFKQTTAFHRSLFMGTAGRWMVAISSIFLLLISISGLFIVAQKLGGWLNFFSSLKKENKAPYYHTVLGRYSFLFIIIISLSGAVLFWKDALFKPKDAPELETYLEDANPSEELTPLKNWSSFQSPIKDIISLEFPFSPDVEDPYILETKGKSQILHQYTGEIVEEYTKASTASLQDLFHRLHTGQNFGYWPILLLLSCLSILYFIYSGLQIIVHRAKSAFKNNSSSTEAETILFVGSESGSTWEFAKVFHKLLESKNIRVFTTGMEAKKAFPKAKNVFIFTSTYGLGDSPVNAKSFWKNNQHLFTKDIHFSVVGFGSKNYPDFCQYAFDLQKDIEKTDAVKLLDIFNIDNKNEQQFSNWVLKVGELLNIDIKIESKILKPKPTRAYSVIENSYSEAESPYFTLKLKVSKWVKSGDLISLFSPEINVPRQYSIAKIDPTTIVLYIRKHSLGKCSTYLSELKPGQTVMGYIEENRAFRLIRKQPAICIGNGTGLAPFIGFSQEANRQPISIYWGTRNKKEFTLIESFIKNKESFNVCFSQEENYEKKYVTQLVIEEIQALHFALKNGTHVYICGAVQIEIDVLNALKSFCKKEGTSFSKLKRKIHSDCY